MNNVNRNKLKKQNKIKHRYLNLKVKNLLDIFTEVGH
jgi:hypothetical protein